MVEINNDSWNKLVRDVLELGKGIADKNPDDIQLRNVYVFCVSLKLLQNLKQNDFDIKTDTKNVQINTNNVDSSITRYMNNGDVSRLNVLCNMILSKKANKSFDEFKNEFARTGNEVIIKMGSGNKSVPAMTLRDIRPSDWTIMDKLKNDSGVGGREDWIFADTGIDRNCKDILTTIVEFKPSNAVEYVNDRIIPRNVYDRLTSSGSSSGAPPRSPGSLGALPRVSLITQTEIKDEVDANTHINFDNDVILFQITQKGPRVETNQDTWEKVGGELAKTYDRDNYHSTDKYAMALYELDNKTNSNEIGSDAQTIEHFNQLRCFC
jgi:hypothetical protein